MARHGPSAFGLSDPGMERETNEDVWLGPPALSAESIAAKGHLYIVADGVGGHRAGDVASRMAAQVTRQAYYADTSPDVRSSLRSAIQEANRQVYHQGISNAGQFGMSTTLTAALVLGDKLVVANVGDSRVYLVRGGKIRQLTVDHTWVEERRHAKILTDAEAVNHPQRNVITRSLGSDLDVDVDVFDLRELKPSDRLLLCTDGLSDLVTKQEIASVISRARAPEEAARRLVAMAKKRGAPDNVTAVVVDVGGKGRARSIGTSQSNLMGLAVMLAAVLVVGVAAVLLPRYVDLLPRANATPTPESSLNSTPTASFSLPTPILQGPDDGAGFYREEEIALSWSWPSTEAVSSRFSITVTNDVEGRVLTHTAEPGSGKAYTYTFRPQSVELEDGTYRWTVAAQQETEGAWETAARAEEWWSFRVGSDPQDDLKLYNDLNTLADTPIDGLDILGASVASDRRITLQPTEGVPQELADWVEEGEALLWIELYDPIPETMSVIDWLFVLDLDGDIDTGRPAGNNPSSPDLGVDVVVGLSYNREEPGFDPYFGVWDSDQGRLIYSLDVARHTLNESRTLIGLAVPLDALREAAQTVGTAWRPEATIGRAAAVFYAESENIIDLYPEP